MQLRLVVEETGQSWMLDSNREYIVGSNPDCDVTLQGYDRIAPKHLKLSFDVLSNLWNVQDLSGSRSTVMNSQTITYAPIQQPVRVQIAGSVSISLTPQTAPAVSPPTIYSPPSQSTNYSTESVRESGYLRETVTPQYSNAPIQSSSTLKVLPWDRYVREQVSQHEGMTKLATRFALLTGLRNTPWVGKGDGGFDGYVIPNFQGSIEQVISTIEQQIGKLQQYEDTDCYIAELTDAHLANSTREQKFSGVDFFPIRRGRRATRGDFRRFCVTAYHRVRTYVLVERYGSDVFVSWITRFEPQPSPVIMIVWLVVASILTLFLLVSNNFAMIIMPLAIWAEIYLLVPSIMEGLNILPKGSNARLLIWSIVILTILFLSFFAAQLTIMRYRSGF